MNSMIARAIALGMAIQQQIHSPSDDLISLSKAARYLLSLGYKNPKKVLRVLQDEGRLHIRKPQGANNNKCLISVVELNGLLLENSLNR